MSIPSSIASGLRFVASAPEERAILQRAPRVDLSFAWTTQQGQAPVETGCSQFYQRRGNVFKILPTFVCVAVIPRDQRSHLDYLTSPNVFRPLSQVSKVIRDEYK